MLTAAIYKTKVMTDMSNKTITLKVTTELPLHGVAKGGSIVCKVDKNGIPTDKNWRKRLRDSKIDGCVEVVTATQAKSKKETK